MGAPPPPRPPLMPQPLPPPAAPDLLPMFQAIAAHNQADLVLCLRRSDAAPNACDAQGVSALMHAVCHRNAPAARALLAAGARIAPCGRYRETPVMAAAGHECSDLLNDLLVHARATMSAPAFQRLIHHVSRRDRSTAVLRAFGSGRPDNVRLLIAAGADPTRRDRSGAGALIWAVVSHQAAAVACALQYGADPNETTVQGCSALMLAAKYNLIASTQLLLRAGADPDWADPDGATAASIAKRFDAAGVDAVLSARRARTILEDAAGRDPSNHRPRDCSRAQQKDQPPRRRVL